MTKRHTIRWADRVKRGRIRRLYALNSKGVYDEELLDQLGWGLHARCRDALVVHRAVGGEVPCPECAEIVPRPTRLATAPDPSAPGPEQFDCPHCERALTWRECRDALRNRPLCLDCTRLLTWSYSANDLACDGCGCEWSWQEYLRSIKGRVWLPCAHCSTKVRRPKRKSPRPVPAPASEAVECPKCEGQALHERGLLTCPHCGYEVKWSKYRGWRKRRVERLECGSCGHEFTWQAWRENYRHDYIMTGNPGPLKEFMRKWPLCDTPQQKMIRIDLLLHAVHGRGALGPVLIEGSESAVATLLDELAGQR